MNTNTEKYLQIILSANELGNDEIARVAVIGLAKEYGIMPNVSYAKSLKDITLYTPLDRSNRITAIKELRERAMENGLSCGFVECKEEVDFRLGIDPW